MTLKQANDLAMGWIDKADVSESSREFMFSSVAWFLFKMDKEGYEIVPRVKFQPGLTIDDIKQMGKDKVIY